MKKQAYWERELLLDDAGELSARRRRRLDEVLRRDPELAARRAELTTWRRALAPREEDCCISDFVREQIHAEARRRLSSPRPGLARTTAGSPWRLWRPAAVYATLSVAVLLFGALLLLRPPAPDSAPQAAATESVDEWLLALTDEWGLRFEEDWQVLSRYLFELDDDLDGLVWLAEDGHADDWARELLALEDT